MASARDRVISGDYVGAVCWVSPFDEHVVIDDSKRGKIVLTKYTVKEYEVLDVEQHKSGTSGILRAGAGALLLGPIGLAAGLTAKKKGIYTIAIEFYNGKRSLIEVGEKIYKKLVQDIF